MQLNDLRTRHEQLATRNLFLEKLAAFDKQTCSTSQQDAAAETEASIEAHLSLTISSVRAATMHGTYVLCVRRSQICLSLLHKLTEDHASS